MNRGFRYYPKVEELSKLKGNRIKQGADTPLQIAKFTFQWELRICVISTMTKSDYVYFFMLHEIINTCPFNKEEKSY